MNMRVGVLIGVLAVITGCGAGKTSPIPRYYLLGPAPSEQEVALQSSDIVPVSINIINVHIPEYLARPQIVTRVGPSELVLAEFDRWAEPLSNQLIQVVADQLTQMLTDRDIVVTPMRRHAPASYQVEIDISRLDGNLQGELTLIARWIFSVQNSEASKGRVLRENLVKFKEPVTDGSYRALVKAHNQVIKRFCEDVAAGIRNVLQ